jgi:hypothetical protein
MQNIFRRCEKKYLITSEQGAALQKLTSQYTAIDQQGEYLVQDLYYDTDNWDIICKSMEKPLYKEKLRLRLYGQYSNESRGFLEMKRKYDGIVYKRRIAFPFGELKNHRIREIVSADGSQISREINFFLQNNPVSEKIHIAYKRTAYNDTENNGLRITFDRDIAFHLCPLCNDFFSKYDPYEHNDCQIDGYQILDPNQTLMEIKTTGAIPLWLTRALSENNIYPVSFSKFGVCYARYILKWQSLEGRKNVA